jgi:lipopolysaccharide transport protein LptA
MSMAVFYPEMRAALLVALLGLAGSCAAATPRAAARPSSPQPIEVDAVDSQIDTRANRVTLTKVTISQGGLSIQADKAVANGTGLSFNESRWEFDGAVRIRFEGGLLQAASATVRFAGDRIAQAEASGSPAEFQQQLESMARPVRGHAERIDYDFLAQKVRLNGGAWLFDGRNEMTSASILYLIKDQIAQNEASAGGRVHITIRPETGAESPANPPMRPESRQ